MDSGYAAIAAVVAGFTAMVFTMFALSVAVSGMPPGDYLGAKRVTVDYVDGGVRVEGDGRLVGNGTVVVEFDGGDVVLPVEAFPEPGEYVVSPTGRVARESMLPGFVSIVVGVVATLVVLLALIGRD